MKNIEEERIRNLRTAGWGYKAIAEFCALTRDQVRSTAPAEISRPVQWWLSGCAAGVPALFGEVLGLGFAPPPAGIKRGGNGRKPSQCASRPVRTAGTAS